jgi:hypothetical protein
MSMPDDGAKPAVAVRYASVRWDDDNREGEVGDGV